MTPKVPSRLDTVDDQHLLRRHVEGDEGAFEELCRRHRDLMWSVAVNVCGDRGVAAEGVHDGFVTAAHEADSYRGDGAVSTWLLRTVVKACTDVTRAAGDVAAPITAPPDSDAPGQVDPRPAVRAALQRLPEQQRLALVLCDIHGVPVAEAVEVLDLPVATVKWRCAQGRAALIPLLDEVDSATPGTPEHSTTSDTEDHHGTKGGGHDR